MVVEMLYEKNILNAFILFSGLLLSATGLQINAQEKTKWRFVCVPDFLNRDTEFPQPGFEDGIDFFLQSIKNENPQFVIVPGDLVNGRWPDNLKPTKEAITNNARIYYSAWKERLEYHGLKYFAAVGDHEIGDNPWPPNKVGLVPFFKEQFVKYFTFPLNGPDGFKGTSYFFLHNNVLFIILDVFTEGADSEGGIVADVKGKHLKWVNQILRKNKDCKFKILVGHTPIIGPAKTLNSSGIMLRKGEKSDLWETMRRNKVNLYLCGEAHAVTCLEKDDINQIVHGSLFGWNPTLNYLLVEITENSLKATLKEIENIPIREGKRSMGITITDKSKKEGFKTEGTLIIEKNGKIVSKVKSGYFQKSEK